MSALAAPSPSPSLERYRVAFESRPRADDAMSALQRAALHEFVGKGFPTQRDEEWKYTDLRRLESRSFAHSRELSSLASVGDDRFIVGLGQRFAFVNGLGSRALSGTSPQPPGLTVLTLAQWLASSPDGVAEFLSTHGGSMQAFAQLNAAFLEDGLVVEISDNAQLDEPIYFVHRWSDGARSVMSHPRIIVRAGRNSRSTLVEHYLGSGDGECFTNAVAVIELGDGADLKHYRLQQESGRDFHIGTTHVRARRDSHYTAHSVALGASLGRESTTALLESPGASVTLRGLFAPAANQHIDVHTRIEHIAPHTVSEEEYRGIASGRGRGVFNGKVVVRAGAQKIDARQVSRNLLLSPTAEIDSRPELEIYANDVKCSHGATTGQLDAAALFYLRSRGLSLEAARDALIQAFASSILSRLACAPLRDHVERALSRRFASGASP
jgi:Fe-S cluster assembly protein SufD